MCGVVGAGLGRADEDCGEAEGIGGPCVERAGARRGRGKVVRGQVRAGTRSEGEEGGVLRKPASCIREKWGQVREGV